MKQFYFILGLVFVIINSVSIPMNTLNLIADGFIGSSIGLGLSIISMGCGIWLMMRNYRHDEQNITNVGENKK